MGKTIHVVPHSHWDREWYFTTSRSKVYLMKVFENFRCGRFSHGVGSALFLRAYGGVAYFLSFFLS